MLQFWVLIFYLVINATSFAGDDTIPAELVGSRKPLYEYKKYNKPVPKPYREGELLKPGRKISKLDPADRYFVAVPDVVQAELACKITPVLNQPHPNIPNKFHTSNNLRRKVGRAEVADGDIVYIKGKLRDINCVPIFGAIVELWQNNAAGFDQNNQPSYKKEYDKNFAANGTATSDNEGNFEFITILPASSGPKDRKSTRLNSSHVRTSRMPSSA